MEIRKIKVKMNKPVYLGMSILQINKTLMYKFWFDYITTISKQCKTMLNGYWPTSYSY